MKSASFIKKQDFKYMETEFLYSDWNVYQGAQDKGLLRHWIICGE